MVQQLFDVHNINCNDFIKVAGHYTDFGLIFIQICWFVAQKEQMDAYLWKYLFLLEMIEDFFFDESESEYYSYIRKFLNPNPNIIRDF